MILRSTRVFTIPERAEDFVRIYHREAEQFIRKQDGCRAVRLFRHITEPSTFFVHGWWRDAEAMRATAETSAWKDIQERIFEFALERTRSWHLEVLERQGVSSAMKFFAPRFARFSKAVIKPNEVERMREMYVRFTSAFTVQQPGFFMVRLLRDLEQPNCFFIHSFWKTKEQFDANFNSDEFRKLRQYVLSVMEERLLTWDLALVDDDRRCPLFILE